MEVDNALITDWKKCDTNEIYVAFITDRKYLSNTCIAIFSLKQSCNKNYIYHVFVITQQISKNDLVPLKALECEYFQVHYLSANFNTQLYELTDFPVSATAVIKFRLAEMLPVRVDKVLYLDGDMIIQSNLVELFATDIQDKYAAVVRDPIAEGLSPSALEKIYSNLKCYFNSGMMLLNLKKMREDDISEKLFDYRLNRINYFMDQDALNVVFEGKVEYLPCKYNYMVTLKDYIKDISLPEEYGYDVKISEYERLHQSDIIHFTGKQKPWKEFIPYETEIFMKYYYESPFTSVYCFNPAWPEIRTLQVSEKYIFPFGEIPKGSQIAIWGAGKVGQAFYRQVQNTGFCEIVCVVDEYADKYNQDENTWKGLYKVSVPEKLKDFEIDYIIIAVKREKIAKDITGKAKALCPDYKEEIVWKYPVCP